MSSPIRVGIIGLGRKPAMLQPGLWAVQAHLPYLVASPNFRVTAVCNSTVKSAEASISYHNLGANLKAYGNPEELAKDPDVDLVVVCVNVEKHYLLAKPAILAGKDVFVEWPLGKTTAEAENLTQLAKERGVKTIVGLQARASPLVVKLKEIVYSGKIGKVLSSTVLGTVSFPVDIWPEGGEYYLDIDSGGNCLTIFFGHFLDSFTHVLGPFASISSILKTEFKTINIVNPKGELVTADHPKTSPDHILVQGTLSSRAVASIAYRTVPNSSAIDDVGIRWLITGTEGEIELTSPEIQWQMGAPGTKLKARMGKGSKAENVEFEDVHEVQEVKDRGVPGVNTARVYQAFVERNSDRLADFGSALETHRLLDRILEGQ